MDYLISVALTNHKEVLSDENYMVSFRRGRHAALLTDAVPGGRIACVSARATCDATGF